MTPTVLFHRACNRHASVAVRYCSTGEKLSFHYTSLHTGSIITSMTDGTADERFLRRALDLASQGTGLASPNPRVGAVIVDPQGNIVGTGAYTYDGVKHAEVRALEHAGEKAQRATLYINLDP